MYQQNFPSSIPSLIWSRGIIIISIKCIIFRGFISWNHHRSSFYAVLDQTFAIVLFRHYLRVGYYMFLFSFLFPQCMDCGSEMSILFYIHPDNYSWAAMAYLRYGRICWFKEANAKEATFGIPLQLLIQ